MLSGAAVSIESQTLNAAKDELAYQLNFSQAGKAIVRITTTFTGTTETKLSDYHYTVIDNEYTEGYQ